MTGDSELSVWAVERPGGYGGDAASVNLSVGLTDLCVLISLFHLLLLCSMTDFAHSLGFLVVGVAGVGVCTGDIGVTCVVVTVCSVYEHDVSSCGVDGLVSDVPYCRRAVELDRSDVYVVPVSSAWCVTCEGRLGAGRDVRLVDRCDLWLVAAWWTSVDELEVTDCGCYVTR